jgi:DNA-binding response OmpR family regulator
MGQGSRFIFTLPRVQRASSPVAAPSRTVIVCEDDDVIREVEIEFLQQAGYRTLGFATGSELLASGEAKKADVILMDMGLPGLSGGEVVARLRANSETRDVPVVIVSGSLPSGAALDVAAWLCKPLREGELLREVESAMREPAPKARLLLVEDDLDLAGVIIESFQRLDIEVCHAATGRDAIELTRDFRPELVILDLVLPELDGFGVVAEMRRDDRLASVPLVVYSAAEPDGAERERLRLGPTEFFTKSRISPEDFERHVIRLLDTIVAGGKELSNVA